MLQNRTLQQTTDVLSLTWVWEGFLQSAHFSSAGSLRVSTDWARSVQPLGSQSESSYSDLCEQRLCTRNLILDNVDSSRKWWHVQQLELSNSNHEKGVKGYMCHTHRLVSVVSVRKASLWITRISFLLRSLCGITKPLTHNPDIQHWFSQYSVGLTECVWLRGLTVNGEQRDLGKCPCRFVECGCAESFCRLKIRIPHIKKQENYCCFFVVFHSNPYKIC